MITLGSSRWTSSNPSITLSFAYEKRRSGADMEYRTQVTISTVTGSSYFGYPIYLQLIIGGTERVTQTLKDASPSQWSSAITYTSPWYKVANKTTGTTPVSFKVYSGQGSSRSATYSYNMGVDPAASTISASNGTLGTKLVLNLTRYNSSFTDTITYKCGASTGTVKSGSTAASVDWDTTNGNTVSLAAQNTTGQSVTVEFTVTTYSGGTKVGSNTVAVSMAIPGDVKPSVALDIKDAAGYYDVYGAYVQGYSKLTITATPTLAHGSPIKSCTITANGASYSADRVTTQSLKGEGIQAVTAKVTDARNRSSDMVSRNITVLPYAKPDVNLSAYRCNSSGAADSEGAYMKIEVTSTISVLNGRNSATYKVVHSGGTLTGNGSSFTSAVLECDVASIHSVEVTIADKLSSTTVAAVIPIAFTLIDYYATGRGMSLGKVAVRDGFDCAMPAYFTGGVFVADKPLLDIIYPVGSIYMSTSNVSPQAFFGGTWEQIEDTFLLAAGTAYAAGATGGAAAHTLTMDEMPYHNHVLKVASSTSTASDAAWRASGVRAYSSQLVDSPPDNIIEMGASKAHNNMPPYLVVYMWKRTK